MTSRCTSGGRRTPPTRGASSPTRPTSVSPDMSFLEMLDVVNEELTAEGRGADRLRPRLPRGHLRHLRRGDQRPAARPARRAPPPASSTCARFKDGDALTIEPWRARAFPVVKDLVVDRSAFDRIIAAGGFVSVPTGQRPGRQRHPGAEGRTPSSRWTPRPASAAAPASPPARTPRPCSSPRPRSRTSASCRRASPSATTACASMVARMDAEGFGNCTNHGECEAVCPKEISSTFIARMNRDFLKATLMGAEESTGRRRGGLKASGSRPHDGLTDPLSPCMIHAWRRRPLPSSWTPTRSFGRPSGPSVSRSRRSCVGHAGRMRHRPGRKSWHASPTCGYAIRTASSPTTCWIGWQSACARARRGR